MKGKTGLSKPDLLQDMEDQVDQLLAQKQSQSRQKQIKAFIEDPVRRRYKKILACTFIFNSLAYILVDIAFQVIFINVFPLF